MRYLLPLLLIVAAALLPPAPALAQQTTPTPATDTVTKTVCVSTFAYPTLEALKVDVLAQAKRSAVTELYGEFITALTQVENFTVTGDQIRLLTSGFVRIRQDKYHNGPNLAEVCATIEAYTTTEDRAKFRPVALNKRNCVTDPNLTIGQIRQFAQEEVLAQAVIEYDRRLAELNRTTLIQLVRRVIYTESGFVSGTDSFCAAAQGEVTPVEVLALLALPTPTPTASPTPTRLPTRTPTPTPRFTPTPVAGATGIGPVDGAVYVYVPGGSFNMGSEYGEANEKPVHTVTLSPYWIKQSEVTNAEYGRCVAAGKCSAPGNSRWNDSRYADHPVTHVNWEQASAYAAWVGGSLPSEAQWELACRGLEAYQYPWGNSAPDSSRANFGDSSRGTTAVGSYPAGASPYGLLDMAGNVWEWTADLYAANYLAAAPDRDPTGPTSGAFRVLRGGSYYSNSTNVRCAYRDGHDPGSRDGHGGFRVVGVGVPPRPSGL